MRKKITLLVAVLFGLLAFGVACSPALSDQPVADPHGTPEQQWTWWPWRGCGRAVAWPSCPGRRDAPGCGRRDVAVASLDVAVARRGRGCGARRLFAAVVWLRHADER